MLNDHEVWAALSAHLSGLRRPSAASGVTRAEVGALLARVEDSVSRDPVAAFEWSRDGVAWLTAAGRRHRAGRFAACAIGDLDARVRQRPRAGAVTFSVVIGSHSLTDVGALQAMAGPGTLVQVASQFNCLEAPGPSLVRIADYVYDNTQGPRASVSAFPGTFLRHYAAPSADGARFTQTRARQVDLLSDVVDPDVAQVINGYLTGGAIADPRAFERALERGFERIRVGVHDEVDVVFGRDWGGAVDAPAPSIAQVFTSTLALGGYSYSGGDGDDHRGACASLLRAAYLGTLLAAFDLGKSTAILTLIGGGAFRNALRTIWDALLWAIDRADAVAPSDLAIVLNARDMGPEVSRREIIAATGARRGGVVVTP